MALFRDRDIQFSNELDSKSLQFLFSRLGDMDLSQWSELTYERMEVFSEEGSKGYETKIITLKK